MSTSNSPPDGSRSAERARSPMAGAPSSAERHSGVEELDGETLEDETVDGTMVADLSGLARQAELERLMEQDTPSSEEPTLIKPLTAAAVEALERVPEPEPETDESDEGFLDMLDRRHSWIMPLLVGLAAGMVVIIAIWLTITP